jgi:hypothetical protein
MYQDRPNFTHSFTPKKLKQSLERARTRAKVILDLSRVLGAETASIAYDILLAGVFGGNRVLTVLGAGLLDNADTPVIVSAAFLHCIVHRRL